jgi:hypothetical protein
MCSAQFDCSIADAAASIGKKDRMSMRKKLVRIINSGCAAAIANLPRHSAALIPRSNASAPYLLPSSSLLLPPPESDHSHLRNLVTNKVLSYCASAASAFSSNPCATTAAAARQLILHSLPIIACVNRPAALLTAAVARCSVQLTEKCGFGSESYEFDNQGDDSMVSPVKLLLCVKNSDVLRSAAAIIACFLDEWLEAALRDKQKYVSVYVDAARLGSDVGCALVLECIALQVVFPPIVTVSSPNLSSTSSCLQLSKYGAKLQPMARAQACSPQRPRKFFANASCHTAAFSFEAVMYCASSSQSAPRM